MKTSRLSDHENVNDNSLHSQKVSLLKGPGLPRKATATDAKLKSFVEQVELYKKQLLVLNKDKRTMEATISRLEEEAKSMSGFQEKYDSVVKELDRRREMSDSLQKQVYQLSGELSELRTRSELAEAALLEKEALLETLQNSTLSSSFEYQAAIRENTSLKNDMAQKEAIIQELSEKIANLDEIAERTQQTCDELQSQLFEMENEQEKLVKKLGNKNKENEDVVNENNRLKEELASMNLKVQKLEARLSDSSKSESLLITQKDQEIHELEAVVALKQTEIRDMTVQMSSIRHELEESRAETQRLQKSKELEISQAISEANVIREELYRCKNEIEEEKAYSIKLQATLHENEKAIEQKQTENENLMKEMQRMHSEIDSYKEQIQSLKDQSEMMKQTALKESSEQVVILMEQLKQKQDEISLIKLEVESIHSLLEASKESELRAKADLRVVTESLHQEIDLLQQKNSELKKSLAEKDMNLTLEASSGNQKEQTAKKLSEEVKRLNADLLNRDKENKEYKKSLQSLKVEVEQLKAQKEILDTKLAEADRAAIESASYFEKIVTEYKDHIEELKEKYRRADKAIVAFEEREAKQKHLSEKNSAKALAEIMMKQLETEEKLDEALTKAETFAKAHEVAAVQQEEIRRLNSVITRLRSSQIMHEQQTGSMAFSALRLELGEIQRKNERLVFENKTLSSSLRSVEASLSSMKRRLEEEHEQRHKIMLQLKELSNTSP